MGLRNLFDGLAFRIGLLLTVAMFPIGLIAVTLTRELANEESEREGRTLMALTAEAAAGEASFIRAGASVADALAAAVPRVRQSDDDCTRMFADFIAGDNPFLFAGYIDRNGIVSCGSAPLGTDFSGTKVFLGMKRDPQPRIVVAPMPQISTSPVVMLLQPVLDSAKAFDGYVTVAVPNSITDWATWGPYSDTPVELVTFDSSGAVMSAKGDSDTVGRRLPRDVPLVSLVGQGRQIFVGATAFGERRTFAVVPMIPGQVLALGSWPVRTTESSVTAMVMSPLAFASIMWMVSLGVAYLAVHRLAIRNISDLKLRMRKFTASRRFDTPEAPLRKPLEFREIDQTWQELAETVVRDEAEMENTIHSRTILLREVHHRVKNNLQLISSIISMKIRKATAPEARAALKEVQMRVMSIATVHRALYTTSTVGMVRADELLRSIVDKTIQSGLPQFGGVRIETAYDPVSLYPDQAVPLSLLASEALTNALKYVGRPVSGGAPWLTFRLVNDESGTAQLEIGNSVGIQMLTQELAHGTGMGASLMQAFAQQLRGQMTTTEEDGRYTVVLRFPITWFDNEEHPET